MTSSTNLFANSSLFDPAYYPSEVVDNAPLIATLVEKGLPGMVLFLRQKPALVNAVLNEKGETPLIIAIQQNAFLIVCDLLDLGADLNQLDYLALSPLDHASFQQDIKLHALLNSEKKIRDELQILLNRLEKKLTEDLQNHRTGQTTLYGLRAHLLAMALTELHRQAIEINFPGKLLDLYLTITELHQLCRATLSEHDLYEAISAFLSFREDLLCGDGHDYATTSSLANHLLSQAVESLCPNVRSVANVLYKNALQRDRETPWVNPYTLENELPIAPGEFFRSATNRLHLYFGILGQAIAQLKKETTEASSIWLATDLANTANHSLTADEIHFIKQRSLSFQNLIDHSSDIDISQLTQIEQQILEELATMPRGIETGRNFFRHLVRNENFLSSLLADHDNKFDYAQLLPYAFNYALDKGDKNYALFLCSYHADEILPLHLLLQRDLSKDSSNFALLKSLSQQPGILSQVNAKQETALQFALKEKKEEVVRYFLTDHLEKFTDKELLDALIILNKKKSPLAEIIIQARGHLSATWQNKNDEYHACYKNLVKHKVLKKKHVHRNFKENVHAFFQKIKSQLKPHAGEENGYEVKKRR